MPSVMTLWDAGPMIALIDLGDDDHELCSLVLHELQGDAVTTEAVVAEVHYVLSHLRDVPRLVLDLLDGWEVDVVVPDSEMRLRQVELMAKYRDAPMDYADATLVAAGERLRISRIFTLDRRHFLTYRLYDREPFEILP